MDYNWDDKYPLWKRKPTKPKRNEMLINGRIVRVYPDNDGGLWYWHPETGEEVRIRE